MDLRTELGRLPGLQEVDLQIGALRAERQRLQAGEPWVEVARAVASRQRRASALGARRAELEKAQRLAEGEREQAIEEAARVERRLYGGEVRNVRDLEGLQKNLQGVRERISALETGILEAMEGIEGVDAELGPVRKGLAQAEQVLARQRSEGGQRLAAIETELSRLEAERARVAATVDPGVLAEYDRVRVRAGGVGVARLSGSNCGACNVEASPLLVSRVRKLDRVYTCESCGRILVEG